MCKDCGCGQPEQDNGHWHNGHFHRHANAGTPHQHSHDHDNSTSRTITIEKKILSRNDEMADKNRYWLAERGVVAVNMISSPGSGKTFLLERTLERLRDRVKCAVITGDQQTDNDARRLAGKGAEVRQIETISACHLDAEKVGRLLPEIITTGIKLLFIENVGNLVCPAAFDLGENFKIALLSVTEGEDKPVKYPSLFSLAPVVILTKTDLIQYLDWDITKCRDYLRHIHPGVFIFELSAKTGQGMDAWIDYLEKLTK
ncbi:MAG: hydrogenase nickel incorporation protein HypB [Kiritimatiellae bacterium]|nr:hydrogenase nickel incorporation protein HypB [Kiritimatiellia bacterium]MDD5521065.1 hydrogenase nickel incorporation protein HypB [Kiritimatiellia bacterium]